MMVLVSLAVAALVVLAALLTTLQCVKVRRAGARTRYKGTSLASEDSDYSSFTGEEETRMGDTLVSDTSSVQVRPGTGATRCHHTIPESSASPEVTEAAAE